MIDNKIKEFIESLIEEERKEFMNNLNKESTLGLEKKELAIKELVEEAHKNAVDKGFWKYYITTLKFNADMAKRSRVAFINEFLTLIASEVFEAQQALRKNDKANFKEEIADIFIRTADLCGGLGIDIEEEIKKKMEYNKGREKMHGKLF